jgi:hypothetical protein
MTNNEQILERLEKLAYKKSQPFCIGCYLTALTGRCEKCGSDDLARELVGEGVEWGTSHVIEYLVRENLIPIDIDEEFEESIRQCYPETVTVGWLTLDTVSTIRDSDPVSWRCARGEWIDSEEKDDLVISFDGGSTYHRTSDVEEYLDQEES